MAVLPNPRHERFAQEIAKGTSVDRAYQIAGYAPNSGNARRLKQDERVVKRIEALLSEQRHIHEKGACRAIEKTGMTIGRVIEELAKIGFADIRKAVQWRGELTREEDNPDGGDILVIKEIFSNHVRLIDSDKLDEATAAAIAEVRQSPTGGLSIKLHDNRAALVDIGRHLGAFPTKVEVSGTIRHVSDMPDSELEAIARGAEPSLTQH